MTEVKDFLNPNSMITPGVAGSITMMIANTLWVNFGLEPKYTALMLCLLLGLVVLAELKVPLWQKPVYYILNVLIIYSVSAGTNVVGMTANSSNLASQTTQITEEAVAVSLQLPSIHNFFINSAMAKQLSTQKSKSASNQDTIKSASIKLTTTTETAKSKLKPSEKSKRKGRKFFQSWF